jgi:hypothetical protein
MEMERDCLGNRLWKWKGTVGQAFMEMEGTVGQPFMEMERDYLNNLLSSSCLVY